MEGNSIIVRDTIPGYLLPLHTEFKICNRCMLVTHSVLKAVMDAYYYLVTVGTYRIGKIEYNKNTVPSLE